MWQEFHREDNNGKRMQRILNYISNLSHISRHMRICPVIREYKAILQIDCDIAFLNVFACSSN